jgi:hypothetical protein
MKEKRSLNQAGLPKWTESFKQDQQIADSADFVEKDARANLWRASHTAVHV